MVSVNAYLCKFKALSYSFKGRQFYILYKNGDILLYNKCFQQSNNNVKHNNIKQ